MHGFETRVGAYGVVIEEGRILLAHTCDLGPPVWVLPGGGLELGEDGPAAAVREIFEETGYRVVLEGLLAADSEHVAADRRLDGRPLPLHSLRLVYRARIVGGTLTKEVGGTTDDVRWFALREVAGLEREGLVDAAIHSWHGS